MCVTYIFLSFILLSVHIKTKRTHSQKSFFEARPIFFFSTVSQFHREFQFTSESSDSTEPKYGGPLCSGYLFFTSCFRQTIRKAFHCNHILNKSQNRVWHNVHISYIIMKKVYLMYHMRTHTKYMHVNTYVRDFLYEFLV